MISPADVNDRGINLDFELNYPWINKRMFEKLIRKDYKNDEIIIVEQFSLEPALKKGENYASEMIRAKVDYSLGDSVKKQKNFVIKAQFTDAPETFKQNELFSREIAVFDNIIPLAEEMLRKIGDNTKFSARCYEANSEKHFLVFEDLATHGYRNVERKMGLTMNQFKSAFLLLAKWHATTAVLFQTKPHIMSPFVTMFKSTYYESLLKSIIKSTAQFTEECLPERGYRRLTKKLKVLSEEIFLKVQQSMERNSKELNCLCHIDLWTNNIMFNDTLPPTKNSLLIDFQMVYVGSPVLDLCYSLFSSSDISMREKEFDELICFYHQELSSMLQKLGQKTEIPTLETLQYQMLKRGIYGVPIGIFETVERHSEKYEEDLTDLLVSDSEEAKTFRLNLFKNPKCRDKVMFLLNYFESKGYFDNI